MDGMYQEAEAMAMQTRWSWDPGQEMHRLQREMEHLYSAASEYRATLTGEYPPINVTRGTDGITLEAQCPGADREKLDVTVVGDSIAIRGERQAPADVPSNRYLRHECRFGPFARTVRLGERLDPDRTQASYTNGILRVTLARAPEATPKKIEIRS